MDSDAAIIRILRCNINTTIPRGTTLPFDLRKIFEIVCCSADWDRVTPPARRARNNNIAVRPGGRAEESTPAGNLNPDFPDERYSCDRCRLSCRTQGTYTDIFRPRDRRVHGRVRARPPRPPMSPSSRRRSPSGSGVAGERSKIRRRPEQTRNRSISTRIPEHRRCAIRRSRVYGR